MRKGELFCHMTVGVGFKVLLQCRERSILSDTEALGQLVSCEECSSTQKKQGDAADEVALARKG